MSFWSYKAEDLFSDTWKCMILHECEIVSILLFYEWKKNIISPTLIYVLGNLVSFMKQHWDLSEITIIYNTCIMLAVVKTVLQLPFPLVFGLVIN